ncbi:DUF4097 family beta strand repeat-containing protein [Saccharothrix sp. Mg75]|uniref:DUF4097 family beta strand repeat-containing protein n=1 Tax=Saccharothrix sp. Mg75 TaxID=3445357 RepID=UPI003EEE7560
MSEGAVVVKRIAWFAVVAVAAVVPLTSCVRLVQEGFDDRHAVTGRVAEIRVQNGSGNVVVRSGTGATSTDVRRQVRYPKSSDRPSGESHRLEGDVLVLDGCGNPCSVDYEVVVPSADVRVTGEVGSGDVRLEGVASVEVVVDSGNAVLRDVSGAVRVENGSGDVEAASVGGAFSGRVDSGNARLSGMRGAVTVENGSGDVDVEMAVAAPVHASASSGNVLVRVPEGAYRVDAVADSGDRVVDVREDAGAAVELVLRSDSGNVAVRTR